MRYYAALNVWGFANTWDVLVFNSKKSRDTYVSETDGYDGWNGNNADCRAIKKSEVTGYAANWSMTRNERVVKPKPFTRECWMISDYVRDYGSLDGYIGNVVVGNPEYDSGERLF